MSGIGLVALIAVIFLIGLAVGVIAVRGMPATLGDRLGRRNRNGEYDDGTLRWRDWGSRE